ncbi:hypothetical protein DYY67_1136 [Candidatus Nitrosotalea sp. TS]|nr:hypothetical protein [Candidatus Nitrosotalea sp. TS]
MVLRHAFSFDRAGLKNQYKCYNFKSTSIKIFEMLQVMYTNNAIIIM